MKKSLLMLASFISISAYSNCAQDFNKGISEFQFANRNFDMAANLYQRAVDLSRTSNPSLVEVCNYLVDSAGSFYISKDSFNQCEIAFISAQSTCSGRDRDSATSNRDICTRNKNTARENNSAVKDLIKRTCYRGNLRELSTEKILDLNEFELHL